MIIVIIMIIIINFIISIVIIIFYTVPLIRIVKIGLPVVCASTLLSIAGKCYCRRLRKNKTEDNQESDNKEIDYQSTRCPEKNPQGDMV